MVGGWWLVVGSAKLSFSLSSSKLRGETLFLQNSFRLLRPGGTAEFRQVIYGLLGKSETTASRSDD